MKLAQYVQDLILQYNAQHKSAQQIADLLGIPYTAYHIRKFLKSQTGIFIVPKRNPNPPVDQVTTYKIINMYGERLPLTDDQIKQAIKSHRKIKGKRKYTLRDLATKLNLSHTTIYNIIHANRDVDMQRRRAMRHAEEDKMAKKFNRERNLKRTSLRTDLPKDFMLRKRGPQAKSITPEQFWDDIYKTSSDGCWIWQGHKDKLGYGRCRWGDVGNTKHSTVSRIAATLTDPPLIPDIYVPERIKLTCASPKVCCNPAHMTVFTTKARARYKIKLMEAGFVLRQVITNIKTKEELAQELNIKPELVDRIISNPELVRNK